MSENTGDQPAGSKHVGNGWLPAEFRPGRVSVITPTFNRAHLVGETLRTRTEAARLTAQEQGVSA